MNIWTEVKGSPVPLWSTPAKVRDLSGDPVWGSRTWFLGDDPPKVAANHSFSSRGSAPFLALANAFLESAAEIMREFILLHLSVHNGNVLSLGC